MRPRFADLFDALNDPDPNRADAAYDAILFERGEALADLTELYERSKQDEYLRFLAVQLLGFTEDRDAIPVVLEALDDPAPGVRAEACRALEDLRARDAGDALKARVTDVDPTVRRAARDALSALGLRRRRR